MAFSRIEDGGSSSERAILVGVIAPQQPRWVVEDHLQELEQLSQTAGASVVQRVTQNRRRPDSAYYVGEGKVNELAHLAKSQTAQTIIFDDDLTPAQVSNLEKRTGAKILDRSGLILDIFAMRAKTREAMVQVELAQLEYWLPRLTRHWTHLSRQEGGIGTKGPGEKQLEVDRRLVRNRIAKLRRELRAIEVQRTMRRKARDNTYRIALIGYTNAGKTSLFNVLTGARNLVENRLFATLDSTVKTLALRSHNTILLSDTVGFIRKLPHHLVASFQSTLEEAREAHLLLNVIDISHPLFRDHIEETLKVLGELHIADKRIIHVFNKIDACPEQEREDHLLTLYPRAIFLSAKKGVNLDLLKERIASEAKRDFLERTITIPSTQSKLIADIHQWAEVVDEEYFDNAVKIHYVAARFTDEKIKKQVLSNGGRLTD